MSNPEHTRQRINHINALRKKVEVLEAENGELRVSVNFFMDSLIRIIRNAGTMPSDDQTLCEGYADIQPDKMSG